jgi:hypothetical protein
MRRDAVRTSRPWPGAGAFSVRAESKVRIPNASHSVVGSNEADVLGEMNAFLATLPPQ